MLKTCSYANFSACFPTPAARVPGALELLHEQFIENLGDKAQEEFDHILRRREVVGRLNELDGLVEEGRRRKLKGERVGEGGVA